MLEIKDLSKLKITNNQSEDLKFKYENIEYTIKNIKNITWWFGIEIKDKSTKFKILKNFNSLNEAVDSLGIPKKMFKLYIDDISKLKIKNYSHNYESLCAFQYKYFDYDFKNYVLLFSDNYGQEDTTSLCEINSNGEFRYIHKEIGNYVANIENVLDEKKFIKYLTRYNFITSNFEDEISSENIRIKILNNVIADLKEEISSILGKDYDDEFIRNKRFIETQNY